MAIYIRQSDGTYKSIEEVIGGGYMTQHYVLSSLQLTQIGSDWYYLLPAVDAQSLSAVDVTSGTAESGGTETEFLRKFYVTSILATSGRLKGYRVYVKNFYVYVHTFSGTYYYRIYFQPVVLQDDGTIITLDTERYIEYSRGAASSSGWYKNTVNASIAVSGLDLEFSGALGIRIRTTAWNSDQPSAYVGHGLSALNDPTQWLVLFDIKL